MGNALYGQQSTMGALSTDLHIEIEDQIVNFPKYRRELINRLSGKNFKKDVTSHKYEWSARDNRKLQAKLAFSIGANNTTMTVDEPGVFNVDDVFQMVGGAQFIVEDVSGGVSVTFRKIAGTQVSQLGNAAVVIIGGGTAQGKDADNMVTTSFGNYYNFTSIIEDVVDLSGTEHKSMIRGDENSGQLIARKQMELTEKLQRQLVVGKRSEDLARKTTTMAGAKDLIDLYAPQNALDFGGNIWASDRNVQDKLDAAFAVIAEKAFEKPIMLVGQKFMAKFKYVQDDQTRTTIDEKSRGYGVVRKYNSHTFGEIDVVQLQGMGGLMDDLVLIIDESQYGYKAMKGRAWFTTPLAKMGDSYRWQVLGEYTSKLDVPEAAVYFYNLGL